ncbi:colanic acid biosynthesis glycosyl transferase WcaI [Lewinella marina]|uniref:Colanic acid biosynthesis glycosyltransferase WcaI n=1 Tax=Neolewinella marina TaxID=438751 RepID=A0A2G0CE63_9BACT|nr:WcaI family glycosyltransferase [Neolewinella marina]NJB87428.1 colanic acid biosynthesis glycosyl transferase WcaI [Neolewinella marina]PHK98263.1 colanic acid biosynthesis glycosyltransferase WcaI [Neolewinella marina]
MKVLIYGINYAPELTGIGKYSGEMATYFAAQGDEVEVITAPPYYPHWKVKEGYANAFRQETVDGVRVLRCPLYVPEEVTGMRRILHEMSFVLSSLRYWIPRYFRSYDAIICVSPPFHLGFPALVHHWLRGTPVINHIQDLQVDAARDLGIIRQNGLLRLLERSERWLLNRVTAVSTISDGMRRKILQKGIPANKIIMFPNWVDGNLVYPVSRTDSAREEWGFGDNDRLVLYAGNLGEKQGLENILLLADRMRDVPRLTFLIIGEGGAKARLVAEAERMELSNVIFKPLQPLERLAASLAAADVHLVLQKKAAADLVMPSKLTNILAVGGHALITAEAGTTLHDLVQTHHLGTLVAPEDVSALENGLRKILAGECEANYRGARTFAAEQLDKRNILFGFRQILTQNTKQHNTWNSPLS